MCVCNETYCDTIAPVTKIGTGLFLKYTSNDEGLRFEKETGNFTTTSYGENRITIDSEKVFQHIYGFGGALTDSTCLNILSLNENVRSKLMK